MLDASLYHSGPLPFVSPRDSVAAGYTQRRLPVAVTSFSGQKTVQTYMATVSVITFAGLWLWDIKENSPHRDLQGRIPYSGFRIFTTSLSSPDGDLPYKKGDYFVPSGNLIGLVANTQHGIRGVLPRGPYYELTLEAHNA